MTPLRVRVKGFLCYRDEQVIDFDGCDLWAFSGRNGSGKSAIFDAITFALFGRHRGGSDGAENLINADSSEFSVIFDFDLGTERYRITRSLRRGGPSERQVYHRETEEDGTEHWPAVPDTKSDAGFRQWVEENVGIQFKAFTSSVLLQQGEAEKLLGARPKERFETLAELIDLERYRRLHKIAEERRGSRRGLVDGLRAQLANMPIVDPEAVAAAEDRLNAANEALATASAERERLNELEVMAGRWSDLVGQRTREAGEREAAEKLLAGAEAIRRALSRLRELDGTLPVIHDAIARRAKIAQAVSDIEGRRTKKAELDWKHAEITRLASENQEALQGVLNEINHDEDRCRAIIERQGTLTAPIHRARQARSQRESVERLAQSLAEFPADLPAEVERLDDDCRRREEWKAAWPSLRTLADARAALADARTRGEEARGRVGRAEVALQRSADLLTDRQVAALAARTRADEAKERSTVGRTTLRAAQKRLVDFEGLEGAGTCDRCRQPLSPGHFADELARLRDECDAARRESDAADRALREAEDRASAAESERSAAEDSHREADAELRKARGDAEQAAREAETSTKACSSAFDSLDETFHLAIAPEPVDDWLATSYPTPEDLAEGRQLRDGLSEGRRSLDEARSRLAAMRETKAQRDQARCGLDAIGLRPGDDSAEAEHAALAKEAAALQRCLASHRNEKQSAEVSDARMGEQIGELGKQVAAIGALDTTARSHIREWESETARYREDVPEPWRAAFDAATRDRWEVWETERSSLRDRGIEAIAAGLDGADAAIRRAESAIEDCDERIASIPEEARRDPKAIVAAKAGAVDRLKAAEEDLRDRRVEGDALLKARDDRAVLELRRGEAARSLAVADELAKCLGREGLQRELLRGAEQRILEYAQPILRELSGGDLDLQLAGEGRDEAGDERALALEALVRMDGSTVRRDPAYLSGSQRFRVAVSLALAIGQYARGLDRPIRSVIIDEGFGCLDRQGRDEMIAELNRLKGRLDRIILVSHQEEFADAFRDGYTFEVRDGTTVATPYHR